MDAVGGSSGSASGSNAVPVKNARAMKPQMVKNKKPAPVQITAEQLMLEAFERQEQEVKPPEKIIQDEHELQEYRLQKRTGFENRLRVARHDINYHIKYAKWEESQRDFERARSIFERAIDMDYRCENLWLKYADMEMRHRFINHARNVWDRAVSLLPRVDQFWFKYAYMEEMLGEVQNARVVFQRWMEWQPEEQSWLAFIKFELRYNEVENARAVFENFIKCHPKVTTYIRYAKFEEKVNNIQNARQVYIRASEELGEDALDPKLFISFAKFEERCREVERARMIYKYALDNLAKEDAADLYAKFMAFEKQYGDVEGIEDAILGKRRFQYEQELRENPLNYDTWFSYVRLEESGGDLDRIRDVYERAIANVPPLQEKRYWKRYIYLWVNYVLFEELVAKDPAQTREVYKLCLSIIPHKVFSFSKIWVMYAQFEVRQRNLEAARKIFGQGIGQAPSDKIFKAYINLEMQLGNVDRCRILHSKWLEHDPSNCDAWIQFADLERTLGETSRARALFAIAVDQPLLDMPEVLWKAFIDFEIEQEEFDLTRDLYERLLQRTKHVKVWISYALFESTNDEVDRARDIFERANRYLKEADLKEERALLLDNWRDFEEGFGSPEDLKRVQDKLPRRIKSRRPIMSEDGTSTGWEEFFDYIFPDDEKAMPNLKLLERARLWKRQKLNEGIARAEADGGEEDTEENNDTVMGERSSATEDAQD